MDHTHGLHARGTCFASVNKSLMSLSMTHLSTADTMLSSDNTGNLGYSDNGAGRCFADTSCCHRSCCSALAFVSGPRVPPLAVSVAEDLQCFSMQGGYRHCGGRSAVLLVGMHRVCGPSQLI
eukprot:1479097-Amphidinium_carterae.1